MDKTTTIFIDEETLSEKEIQNELNKLNEKEKKKRENKNVTTAKSLKEAVENNLKDNPNGIFIKF